MTFSEILTEVINELEDDSIIHPVQEVGDVIPALEKGKCHRISPMLKERFSLLGKWEDATHGDWLDLGEMKNLWLNESDADERTKQFQSQIKAFVEHWEEHILSKVQRKNVTVFALSEYTYESIFLIWKDAIEPEVWVYDVNGESHFKNIELYLVDYLNQE